MFNQYNDILYVYQMPRL